MTVVQNLSATNDLINCLPNTQRKWFLSHFKVVELEFGQVLNATDEPIEFVYFPLTAFISVLVEMSGEQPIEMGLIGSEGMLGATLALGKMNSPMQSVVQGIGKALRIDARSFCRCLKASLPLRNVIHSYLYVLIQQVSLIGACNCSHEVSQRLARWLLMTQDRAHSNQFYLTHQYLARMLGVRRSTVTITAGAFQRSGLISYSRGQINVLSREGLKHASCKCYITALNTQKKNLKLASYD